MASLPILTLSEQVAPGFSSTTSSHTLAVSMHSIRCHPSSAMSASSWARSVHGFQITAEREPLLV